MFPLPPQYFYLTSPGLSRPTKAALGPEQSPGAEPWSTQGALKSCPETIFLGPEKPDRATVAETGEFQKHPTSLKLPSGFLPAGRLRLR